MTNRCHTPQVQTIRTTLRPRVIVDRSTFAHPAVRRRTGGRLCGHRTRRARDDTGRSELPRARADCRLRRLGAVLSQREGALVVPVCAPSDTLRVSVVGQLCRDATKQASTPEAAAVIRYASSTWAEYSQEPQLGQSAGVRLLQHGGPGLQAAGARSSGGVELTTSTPGSAGRVPTPPAPRPAQTWSGWLPTHLCAPATS
jgi:hypothetical protein